VILKPLCLHQALQSESWQRRAFSSEMTFLE
jgi:hypothetical protein